MYTVNQPFFHCYLFSQFCLHECFCSNLFIVDCIIGLYSVFMEIYLTIYVRKFLIANINCAQKEIACKNKIVLHYNLFILQA